MNKDRGTTIIIPSEMASAFGVVSAVAAASLGVVEEAKKAP
jgi:hypothetical protein